MALLSIAFLLLLLPTALSCGGFFCSLNAPVLQTGEAIVFGVEGNKVTMHVQILYEGPAEAFSWVLPVPFQPNVAVGSDQIFSAMFTQTLPSFQLAIQAGTTDTCGREDFDIPICATAEFASDSAGMPPPGSAMVLEEGSVGPFDFVVLEAAENDPSSVFRWLEENGYDQPDEAAALLNYYALADHVFVALKLQKNAEVGEIQPLILEYEMPPSQDMSRTAIACVPIQLTRIAATPQMPITVYVLGDTRVAPLNYMELQLDDTQVDWVGCLNQGPRCYDTDYRDRFDRAAMEISNHTFVTEYAGTARTMDGLITIPVTKEQIANVENQQEFFDRLSFLLPNTALVDSIIVDYMGKVFNATALAEELHEKVLQPAIDDQAYVDGFAYLTRLYARLSPEMMNKDPFFAFKPELGDVDNVHRATGLPICDGDTPGPTALEITVESSNDTVIVPAGFGGCGGWVPFNPIVPVNDTMRISPALQVAAYGFEGDEGVIVLRSANGNFDMEKVQEAVSFGDSLVMSQEIPDYSNQTQAPSNQDTTEQAPTVAPNALTGEPTVLQSVISETPQTATTALPSGTNMEPTIQPSTVAVASSAGPSTETPATSLPSPTMPPSTEAAASSLGPSTAMPSAMQSATTTTQPTVSPTKSSEQVLTQVPTNKEETTTTRTPSSEGTSTAPTAAPSASVATTGTANTSSSTTAPSTAPTPALRSSSQVSAPMDLLLVATVFGIVGLL